MVQYKEFRIGDLFEKLKVPYYGEGARHSDISDVRTETYCIPVTTAKRGDNGICRWAREGQFKTYENVISVVYNGAIAAGLAYYQPNAVASLADSYLIRLQNGELTEQTGLYLACAIQKIAKAKYSRENKAVWKRVKEERVSLPATNEGKPDFDYMAEYIAGFEAEHVADLETYLLATGLNDYELTDKDKEVLSLSPIRPLDEAGHHEASGTARKEIGKFSIGDLFDIINNPQLDKVFFEFTDSAEYPYFTRTENNNGILGYVEYLDEEHMIKGNSLAVGMISMRFHYMPHDFYAGQFTKTLIPKFNGFNEELAMYFIAELNTRSEYYRGFLVREFTDRVSNTVLELPITPDGNPDFEYMAAYIHVQQKRAIAAAVRLKDAMIAKRSMLG